MTKQIIEIECPKGTKAVFNARTQRIEFIPIDPKEKIRTVEDALREIFPTESVVPLDEIVKKLNLSKFVELQAVLKALNGPDFKWNLTKGIVWYPWVRFLREDCVPKKVWGNEKIVGRFKYEGTYYALVGGLAIGGGGAGLCTFYSSYGVSFASAYFSFLSCKDEETARYVSEKFGKLVFEAITAFMVEDIEWLG